jgi:hypothetical protein
MKSNKCDAVILHARLTVTMPQKTSLTLWLCNGARTDSERHEKLTPSSFGCAITHGCVLGAMKTQVLWHQLCHDAQAHSGRNEKHVPTSAVPLRACAFCTQDAMKNTTGYPPRRGMSSMRVDQTKLLETLHAVASNVMTLELLTTTSSYFPAPVLVRERYEAWI